MEKNIASHDVTDMMVYEGMYAQSRRFQFRHRFAPLEKFIEKCMNMYERAGRDSRKTTAVIGERDTGIFSSTAAAVSAITIASILISFFWITLLLSPSI
jgi:hypothetical protein